MRIAIVHNRPHELQGAADWGVIQQVREIETALSEGGHRILLHSVENLSGLVHFLECERPELIFNCCESSALEMKVAAALEMSGIPLTGSPALALGMALDKNITKSLFVAHGVPTAPWIVLSPAYEAQAVERLSFPAIVKPLAEDASVGIGAGSVVENPDNMVERARFIWREFGQPALVEEFIDGRELNVALLANSPEAFEMLPVSEIVFSGFPGRHRVVTYDAKWLADSPEFSATAPQCPAELTPELEREFRAIALRAAAALQLSDYCRIDLRVRSSDTAIFVLEANPNPDISRDSGFARSALASGRTYAGVICEIVERAIERTHAGK